MSASIAVITADSFVPDRLEAKLRLSTLSGSDNPLTKGGRLVRTIPGMGTAIQSIATNATTLINASVLPTALPSPVTFVIEAPTGSRLLELALEVAGYGSDTERVEIRVACTGVTAAAAQILALTPSDYSWRLSGVATVVGGVLDLGFDLVQEEVPTEFVDALASTRLSFGDTGTQQRAAIKVRRSGITVEGGP